MRDNQLHPGMCFILAESLIDVFPTAAAGIGTFAYNGSPAIPSAPTVMAAMIASEQKIQKRM